MAPPKGRLASTALTSSSSSSSSATTQRATPQRPSRPAAAAAAPATPSSLTTPSRHLVKPPTPSAKRGATTAALNQIAVKKVATLPARPLRYVGSGCQERGVVTYGVTSARTRTPAKSRQVISTIDATPATSGLRAKEKSRLSGAHLDRRNRGATTQTVNHNHQPKLQAAESVGSLASQGEVVGPGAVAAHQPPEHPGADPPCVGGGGDFMQDKLEELAKEKVELEDKLAKLSAAAHRQGEEVAVLRMELAKLQTQPTVSDLQERLQCLQKENATLRSQLQVEPPDLQARLQGLVSENAALKGRLQELQEVESCALSDAEKAVLLMGRSASSVFCGDVPHAQESGLPCDVVDSELLPDATSTTPGGTTACASSAPSIMSSMPSLERALSDCWDKQSCCGSSSLSEISVACLQDRLQQMEETHYSTNEELQATLQELADLQEQLGELQGEVERLQEEKAVLLESLCRQTERLEECRSQLDGARQLVVQQSENGGDASSGGLGRSEREQRLIELLKSAQDERESLLQRQEELGRGLDALQESECGRSQERARLRDRLESLEAQQESIAADKKAMENQLAGARQEAAATALEARRVQTLLDNAQAKVLELQAAREVGDRSDLEELLDATRRERDEASGHLAAFKEQLARAQCEGARLREQVAQAQEEARVSRNNAKSTVADLEFQLRRCREERDTLSSQMVEMRDSLAALERQCQRHLSDKRELRASLSEAQRRCQDTHRSLSESERKMEEERSRRRADLDEWEQFKRDLLMTVRVANDFKTEAQEDLERNALEVKALRERVRQLERELGRAKADREAASQEAAAQEAEARQAIRQASRAAIVAKATDGIMAAANMAAVNITAANMAAVNIAAVNMAAANMAAANMAASVAGGGGGGGGKVGLGAGSRVDNRLSVKSLVQSIENSSKGPTPPGGTSPESASPPSPISSSTTTSTTTTPTMLTTTTTTVTSSLHNGKPSILRPGSRGVNNHHDSDHQYIKAPLRDQNKQIGSTVGQTNGGTTIKGLQRTPYSDKSSMSDSLKSNSKIHSEEPTSRPITPVSILSNKLDFRRNSYSELGERRDPLCALAKNGGSKRNALLKWCQNKTLGYRGIDITNFSSSWNDGMALCAILHTYLPEKIPYDGLNPADKRRNFAIAFQAAEDVGIPTTLNINDMVSVERPDWQQVMTYITSVYKHFET